MIKQLLIFMVFSIGLVGQVDINNHVVNVQHIDHGYINVITGEPTAKIFIDGEFIANDFIRKFPLEEGQHYVRIEDNNMVMYAKMVTIYRNELQTITSENFVDIKTTTVSRGAIERESIRLQKTKGRTGLGFIWGDGYPAKGMSLKWISPFQIGVQFSAIGNVVIDNKNQSEIGIRTIFPIGHKIFSNTNFTGYATLGWNQTTIEKVTTHYLGGSVGIEFSFGDPLYFNVDIGVANPLSDTDEPLKMAWSAGLHFFF